MGGSASMCHYTKAKTTKRQTTEHDLSTDGGSEMFEGDDV
jgi:hypothetical protein